MYYYYRIASLTLRSSLELWSFKAFLCDPDVADVTIDETEQLPESGEIQFSGRISHRKIADGWEIKIRDNDRKGIYVNADYSHIRFFGAT